MQAPGDVYWAARGQQCLVVLNSKPCAKRGLASRRKRQQLSVARVINYRRIELQWRWKSQPLCPQYYDSDVVQWSVSPSLGSGSGGSPFGEPAKTGLFGLASLASAVALFLARKKQIRRFTWWFSILVSSALVIATAYLTYWGAIGMRTWS